MLGWLGDMGPGVFIILSGFTLALSLLRKEAKSVSIIDFYKRRLIRIFPLYIVIHIIVLFFIQFFGDLKVHPSSTNVLLSMLGLRFTDNLFFYINPSWWFIWLIIQLYLVFPFLYRLLHKTGIKTFIIITLLFTLISRAAGLLHLTYNDNLSYWMMGIFFGTRLFEFSIGMVLAKLFTEKHIDPEKISFSHILMFSIPLYIVGFILSLFYVTTVISGPMITLGLCGIFLLLWKAVKKYIPVIIPFVIWIGLVSFPVFLLHQPFLQWVSGSKFSGVTQLIVSSGVLLLSFPAGWLIERNINRAIAALSVIRTKTVNIIIILSVTLQLLLNILYFFSDASILYYADVFLFIVNIFFIPLYILLGNNITNKNLQTLLPLFILLSLVFCFVLTSNWFGIFWLVIIIVLLFTFLVSLVTKNQITRIILPLLSGFIIILVTELYLVKNHPVETKRWGEFPALQKDPLTGYSLKPLKKTRLKYNNYDYYVKTNSMGFNGPEADIAGNDSNEIRIMVIGDAFTMPEGMEYERAYPELLSKLLSEKYPDRKIHVFNAGVTGYGPNEMYPQLEKYADTLKPDIFINEVFINEFDEVNIDTETRVRHLAFERNSIREELFAGNQLPKQISSAVHEALKDKIHRDYTYNKSLASYYKKGSVFYTDENTGRLENYFNRIKEFCDLKECTVMVLYAPGQLEISEPKDVDYYPWHINLHDTLLYDLSLPLNQFKKICEKAGVLLLDPSEVLRENKIQPVYFPGSWHWNQEGHRVISEYLAEELKPLLER